MPIIKDTAAKLRKHGERYVTIPASVFESIKDPVSVAIWVYLLSKPDSWVIRSRDIQNRFSIGRDRTISAMKNLRELGLVWDECERGEDGRITSNIIVCSSNPVTGALKNPTPDKPDSGKSGHLVSNVFISNKEINSNTPYNPPEGGVGYQDIEEKTKPSKFIFDHERVKQTWNEKADSLGLPGVRSITDTTERGLVRLYKSYLKMCKQTGREPNDMDTVINGYISHGYQPTKWAMGENPEGKKYGIATALTQQKIDEILGGQ